MSYTSTQINVLLTLSYSSADCGHSLFWCGSVECSSFHEYYAVHNRQSTIHVRTIFMTYLQYESTLNLTLSTYQVNDPASPRRQQLEATKGKVTQFLVLFVSARRVTSGRDDLVAVSRQFSNVAIVFVSHLFYETHKVGLRTCQLRAAAQRPSRRLEVRTFSHVVERHDLHIAEQDNNLQLL